MADRVPMGWLMVPGVTNALTTARDDVVAALVAALAGILPDHRIHRTQPPQPATPMIWLGPINMQPDTIGDGAVPVVAAAGSVLAPVDGSVGAQIDACDVLSAAIWEAINTIATPTGSTVGYLNVGGPQLYGVTVTFTMTIAAYSICPLELITPEVAT